MDANETRETAPMFDLLTLTQIETQHRLASAEAVALADRLIGMYSRLGVGTCQTWTAEGAALTADIDIVKAALTEKREHGRALYLEMCRRQAELDMQAGG